VSPTGGNNNNAVASAGNPRKNGISYHASAGKTTVRVAESKRIRDQVKQNSIGNGNGGGIIPPTLNGCSQNNPGGTSFNGYFPANEPNAFREVSASIAQQFQTIQEILSHGAGPAIPMVGTGPSVGPTIPVGLSPEPVGSAILAVVATAAGIVQYIMQNRNKGDGCD
jgi:hypothetical protein